MEPTRGALLRVPLVPALRAARLIASPLDSSKTVILWNVIFGSASESDREFLYELHCGTMREVIEQTWGWDEAWQRADFDRRFAEYTVSIIEAGGRTAGGLLLEWTPDSLYIELQVLPELQGRGIGTAVVQNVIEQGASRGVPVMLSVVPASPRAKRLYERLGFEVAEVGTPFILMQHNPRLPCCGSLDRRRGSDWVAGERRAGR